LKINHALIILDIKEIDMRVAAKRSIEFLPYVAILILFFGYLSTFHLNIFVCVYMQCILYVAVENSWDLIDFLCSDSLEIEIVLWGNREILISIYKLPSTT
jgi:hypothetical protein